MGDDIAISAEGLFKRYQIGVRRKHNRLLETCADVLATPLRRIRSFGKSSYRRKDSILALDDVSFEVKQGEVMGLIGPNGAGKSTLLKILSRVTCPTAGHAVLNGRVGSLLEIGTGFHYQLTGRENIYVSGAILGMKHREIREQFDQIVDFAGVGKYLDTPVKRYSSGMRVRLGFAVAAHLQPEILLIDEVLAVGDAEFQARCLGRMNSISREGRTILFVSHDLAAIQDLCMRSMLIQDGQLAAIGPSDEVVSRYLGSDLHESGHVQIETEAPRPMIHSARWFSPVSLQILDPQGQPTGRLKMSEPFTIQIRFELKQHVTQLCLTIDLWSMRGKKVATLLEGCPRRLESGCHTVECHVPGGLFKDCMLRIGLDVKDDRTRERYLNSGLLSIVFGASLCGSAEQKDVVVELPCEWNWH